MITVVNHLDLNGTLDQAEDIRQHFWRETALPFIYERYGVVAEILPEVFHASLGLASKDVIPAVHRSVNHFLKDQGIELTVADIEEIYTRRNATLKDEGFDATGYPLREGAIDHLKEFHASGGIITIVTSETVEHAERTLAKADVRGLVAVVTGRNSPALDGTREVRKKPDHESYAVSRALVDQVQGSLNLVHLGCEDTAPGWGALINAKQASVIEHAVHVLGIQGAETISRQLAAQRGLGESPESLEHQMALVNATFSDLSDFYRSIRN